MSSTRRVLLSLGLGVLYALGLFVLASRLGYAVGPSEHSLIEFGWHYGGLVAAAAFPIWSALRYRLLTPLVALIAVTGYVVGMELLAPGPTFHDIAELEGLAEPTGIIVVENGLYVVRYASYASVWLVGFAGLAVLEGTARTTWTRLPSPPEQPLRLVGGRQHTRLIAVASGLVYVVVMTWFAVRLNVVLAGGRTLLLYAFGGVGMWALGSLPLYFLGRYRLFAPLALATLFTFADVAAEFTASVESPHALYFGGWFLPLGLIFLAGGLEAVIRRVRRHATQSADS